MSVVRAVTLIVAVCVLVYGLWLGTPGFASSEGHRVVPGWSMADSGDWLKLEMFGTPYLRKPPGMPWAIGATARLLGYNEWSARIPSTIGATLGALACAGFAWRWFGPRAGLAAGLAQALAPALWSWGRSAEIEMLCIVGTQLAALGLTHGLAYVPLREREGLGGVSSFDRLASVIAIATGAFVAVITKGPAALPVLCAAAVAATWIGGFGRIGGVGRLDGHRGITWRRSIIGKPLAITALVAGIGAAIWLWWRVWTHSDAPGAVKEDGSFLWTRPMRTLLLLPSAWVAALPASLVLLLPILRGSEPASRSDVVDPQPRRAESIASALTAAWLLALVAYTLGGVSNPRYALPAIGLLFPLAGYWMSKIWMLNALPVFSNSNPSDTRQSKSSPARVLSLGHPLTWPALLLFASITSAYFYAHRSEAHITREIGQRIAEIASADPLAPRGPVTVIADGVVEARPDVLLYAHMSSAWTEDKPFDGRVRARWMKPPRWEHQTEPGESAVFVLLRTDESTDWTQSRDTRSQPLAEFRFGKYEAKLYRLDR